MTITEPTPLPQRPISVPTPFRKLVTDVLQEADVDGDVPRQDVVNQIVGAYEADMRQVDADLGAVRRCESEAHEQHRQAWAMLEYVQGTVSLQLRRTAHLYAQVKADAQLRDNLAYLVKQSKDTGRTINPAEIESVITSATIIPMDFPITMLGLVRDTAYRYGAFNTPDGRVSYPYVGIALVTTAREPERICEPAFLVGAQVLPASVMATRGYAFAGYVA